MKTSVFADLIRKLVREEVTKVVRKELRTFMVEQASPISARRTKKKQDVKYSKNDALNKVLNETVGGISRGSEYDEYPSMNNKTYTTNDTNNVGSMASMMGYCDVQPANKQQHRDAAAEATIRSMGKTVDQVPEEVTNAMTKDYSSVMKAIAKKKGEV